MLYRTSSASQSYNHLIYTPLNHSQQSFYNTVYFFPHNKNSNIYHPVLTCLTGLTCLTIVSGLESSIKTFLRQHIKEIKIKNERNPLKQLNINIIVSKDFIHIGASTANLRGEPRHRSSVFLKFLLNKFSYVYRHKIE